MLAVIVFPHGFTTALASEAFIVPRASHRRITPTACLGRVLGAEPQVRCRCLRLPQLVRQLRVAPPFPNRTGWFPSIRLSRLVSIKDGWQAHEFWPYAFRTPPSSLPQALPGFTVYMAFPCADYYPGSVTLPLSRVR